MREASTLQAILSLFTAPDRAESIAGDLTEERDARGFAWFWFHGFRTMFALFRNALVSAPLMALVLVALGFVLFVTLAFAGVAAVFLFPFIGSGARWIVLSLFWWSAALWTGVSLVRVAPRQGMAACLTLAIAWAQLLSCLLFFTSTEPPSIPVYASALFAAAPLLAGGAIARRRSTS